MKMVCLLETRFRIKLIFLNYNDYAVKDISFFFGKYLANVLLLHVLKSKEPSGPRFLFLQKFKDMSVIPQPTV